MVIGKDAQFVRPKGRSSFAVLPIMVSIIAGCGGEGDDTYKKTFRVAAHQEECWGFLAPDLCLLVRESDEDDWSTLAQDVDGFDYQRGYSYRIKVEVDPPDNDVLDAANDYSLEEVLERSAVAAGQAFEFPLWHAADAMEAVSPGLYEVYGRERISCEPSDCTTIDSLLTQGTSILFELRHPADPADPLEMSRILCSAPVGSFQSSCLD